MRYCKRKHGPGRLSFGPLQYRNLQWVVMEVKWEGLFGGSRDRLAYLLFGGIGAVGYSPGCFVQVRVEPSVLESSCVCMLACVVSQAYHSCL